MVVVHGVHVTRRFKVKVIETGSYYDEAKVGNPDEFDFVFELLPLSRNSGVKFTATTDPAFIQVVVEDVTVRRMWQDCLCNPKDLRQYNETVM